MGRSMQAERIRQQIIRRCHAGLDAETLRFEVAHQLRKALPFEAWCGLTADPATLLVTGSVGENIQGNAQRFFEIEYQEEDFHKFADLALYARSVGILTGATAGDLERSPRWREIFGPLGFADELRAALVTDSVCWGYLALHRERSSPDFTPEEAAYLAGLTEHLAEGLRMALLVGSESIEESADGPGLVVLEHDLSLAATTPAAERWLSQIKEPSPPWKGKLPDPLYAVVSRLQALEEGNAPAELMPKIRLRTAGGRWLVAHASRLSSPDGAGKVAIILEEARPWEITPLIVQAYDLSERERELTGLVLRGLSTAEIAAELHISANTVQDHLKAIFDKVGVRSRRELVANIFAQQYWPRLRTGAPVGRDGWFAGQTAGPA